MAVVRAAAEAGRRAKVVGRGCASNDMARTDGVAIHVDGLRRAIDVDPTTGSATVEAGMTLRRLHKALAAAGLALADPGDLDAQSVGGAVATGAHGSAPAVASLAGHVAALQIVTADGEVRACSPERDRELFEAARLGLGALGVVTEVTLRAVPAFALRAEQAIEPLDRVLADLDRRVAANQHFELSWLPCARLVRTRWRNPVDGAAPRPRRTTVDRGYRLTAPRRRTHDVELGYALPRGALGDALEGLRRLAGRALPGLVRPVQVRFGPAEDVWLATSHGRDSAHVALRQLRALPYARYFEMAEQVMVDLGGRPHWGTLHTRTAADLAPQYPHWQRWADQRRRVDPHGMWANAHLARVVGGYTGGQG